MSPEEIRGLGEAAASVPILSSLSPALQAALATLLLAIATFLGHFIPKHIQKRRFTNGHDRRESRSALATILPCALADDKLPPIVELFYTESREFQRENIAALKEMCSASREQTQTMSALAQLAIALAKRAGIDTTLSPLDRGNT